jgi:hypothetical protein
MYARSARHYRRYGLGQQTARAGRENREHKVAPGEEPLLRLIAQGVRDLFIAHHGCGAISICLQPGCDICCNMMASDMHNRGLK